MPWRSNARLPPAQCEVPGTDPRAVDKAARTACGAVHDLLLTEEDCRAALDPRFTAPRVTGPPGLPVRLGLLTVRHPCAVFFSQEVRRVPRNQVRMSYM